MGKSKVLCVAFSPFTKCIILNSRDDPASLAVLLGKYKTLIKTSESKDKYSESLVPQ